MKHDRETSREKSYRKNAGINSADLSGMNRGLLYRLINLIEQLRVEGLLPLLALVVFAFIGLILLLIVL